MTSSPTDVATIAVRVTFMADMRRFTSSGARGPETYRVPAGAEVGDLLDVLGIPRDLDLTVGVDGELAARETPLREGADVLLVSPMEGG